MSWQLGAFLVLFVGLAAGFVWYERARPPARTVALVGTLAALACLGRIAFAAVPNVKPTTDMVLISGYALGGAPGYVVGAVAALTSNVFFGQGPWTPWQMAGWGLTGILGASLAQLTRGRIGRRPLAVVCFVVGFWFTALQDAGDWVTYSDHSLGQLGVYVGQGLGYDLLHALGCVGFALAFGPAMLRALARYRRRLEVRWIPLGEHSGAAGVLVIAALAAAVAVAAPAARAAGKRTPSQYLIASENADGGFGNAPGQPSNPMVSGWVVLALAAAGHSAAQTASATGTTSAAAYLGDSVHADLGDPGSIERTVLAAHAAGLNPAALDGHDLDTSLLHAFRPDGSVAGQTNLTAFGVLAVRAAGLRLAAATVPWLLDQQDADGGFNFATRGGGSDVDDTAAVLEALAAARSTGPGTARGARPGSTLAPSNPERAAVDRAVAFIRAQQNRDGGFPSQAGGPSNAQSTAFAIQGLIAAGLSPGALRRPGGRTPIQYLHAMTQPDGSIRYSSAGAQTPVWVTAEAVLALTGRPLPVSPPAVAGAPPAAATTTSATNGKPGGRANAVGSAGAQPGGSGKQPGGSGAPGSLWTGSEVTHWVGVVERIVLGVLGL